MSVHSSRTLLVLVSCMLYLFIFSSAEKCNPEEKKVLLQIKKELGNPSFLSSWVPTTDCCDPTWHGISCDTHTKTFRVNRLEFFFFDNSNNNLPRPAPFPPSIPNLHYLDSLVLINIPNLVGPIPPSLGNLTNLHNLAIIDTNISGYIPETLSKIKTLTILELANNNLEGPIPPSLSTLRNLFGISFEGNRLSGSIPDSFGWFEPGRFLSLTLSNNRLSGKIPSSLANLHMAFVDLSGNMLEGDASMLFGAEKYAIRINLANNLLAFDFGKVEVPKRLEKLDLSNNRIYGRLPHGLTEVRNLNEFNVSSNNLCGEIPKGGNLQSFDVSIYDHNKCLCGSPLPPCNKSYASCQGFLCCFY